jgi:hypothetical protein
MQILLMKGFGWSNAAYLHPSGVEVMNRDLIQRSSILAFGAATGTYLLMVVIQVVLGTIFTSIKIPYFGNTENPCDAFTYVLPFISVRALQAQFRALGVRWDFLRTCVRSRLRGPV